MAHPIRVLVADDDRAHADMLSEAIRSSAAWSTAALHTAGSYDEACRALEDGSFDVAFLDYWLGALACATSLDGSLGLTSSSDLTGLTLLRYLRRRGVRTPVIVMTGRGAEEIAVEAMKAGASDYLLKTSLTPDTIERSIRHALALHSEERQRMLAESALRASEARFRALVENSSDAFVLMNAKGVVVYMTPSSQRHLGWSAADLEGKSFIEFIHPDDRDLMKDGLAETLRRPNQPIVAEARFRHADGSWRVMEGVAVNHLAEPSVQGIAINARDISDRRRLEEQLRQSQKMEAVGQLAGGVAHDFNNILTAILGYCGLALENVPEGDPLRDDLKEIRAAGERAATLTRQLLAFSRRQMLQPRAVDVNALVTGIESLLRRVIGEDVELVVRLAGNLRPAYVDPASIEQAIVSLAVNARDAMPTGGRLTIETARTEFSDTAGATRLAQLPGKYVSVAVTDTGIGMDDDTQAHIFEPFFTTKSPGKGTGLGLASVYGIVAQSGGHISVFSQPGRGSLFTLHLPEAPAAVERVEAPAGTAAQAHGWETILLVEDEDAVRALAREVLRRHGYSVLEARHGLDALSVAERHPDPIHLMITDFVMPHMNGRDLAERLSGSRPTMKVLFMSGYTDHAIVHRGLTPETAFLEKPFAPESFVRKVRHILDG